MLYTELQRDSYVSVYAITCRRVLADYTIAILRRYP